MAGFDDTETTQVTKLLVLGDSGAGKTGALMALAAAGYNIRILDFDAGLAVLRDYIRNPQSIYRQAGPDGLWPANSETDLLARVRFETITDSMRNVNGKLIPKASTAWQRGIKLLDNWTTDSDKFGPVSQWGPQDVLSIDTMTFASRRAFEFILSMNARLGQQPHQSDYGEAQRLVEGLLSMLYDDGIKCNVVVNCHIAYSEDSGVRKGFPDTVGRALFSKIGRYFNSVVQAKTKGVGASKRQVISTQGDSVIELKNTAPLRVKPEYDLATGLAEFFRDTRGQASSRLGAKK